MSEAESVQNEQTDQNICPAFGQMKPSKEIWTNEDQEDLRREMRQLLDLAEKGDELC